MGAANPPQDLIPFTPSADPRLTMPGQATVCPHLVVVPRLASGYYLGGFDLGHIPTGTHLLSTERSGLTPLLARYTAALVAHLDWSSAALADYLDDSGHRAAWRDALQAAGGLDMRAADEFELADSVELAENQARAGEPVLRIEPAGGDR